MCIDIATVFFFFFAVVHEIEFNGEIDKATGQKIFFLIRINRSMNFELQLGTLFFSLCNWPNDNQFVLSYSVHQMKGQLAVR